MGLSLKKRGPRSTVSRNGSRMSQDQVETNRYLYEQIYSELKEEILSGKYRTGDWFPPERVLKDRFNTTHLTVRNALAKLVLEGYIERYSGKGTIVIYAREKAPAPRRLLSFPWAHLILESLDDGNSTLLVSLEAQLRKVPLALRLSFHHGDVLLGETIYEAARKSGALVILQAPGGQGFGDVALENTIVIREALIGAGCPQVVIDHEEAGRAAARHLFGLGHRRMAVLAEQASVAAAGLARGFLQELASRGLPPEAGVREGYAPGVDGGRRVVQDILRRDPARRAFLCDSDETAASVAQGLLEAGLEAGSGWAVVGWGNTPLAESMKLTSIDPRFDLLAERTIATVLEGMTGGALAQGVFAVAPELRVRDGPPAKPYLLSSKL